METIVISFRTPVCGPRGSFSVGDKVKMEVKAGAAYVRLKYATEVMDAKEGEYIDTTDYDREILARKSKAESATVERAEYKVETAEAPKQPARKGASGGETFAPDVCELPEDVPHRQILIDNGIATMADLLEVEDFESELSGIGDSKAADLEAYLKK